MPPPPERYRQTVAAARANALMIVGSNVDTFLALLDDYASEIEGLPLLNANQASRIIRRLYKELEKEMAKATTGAVRLTANRVSTLYAQATADVLGAFGATAGLGLDAQFGAIGTSAAQAMLSRPELSRSFRSLRGGHYQDVDRILLQGAIRGRTSQQIAMQLRSHILGADGIPEHLLTDRRRIGKAAVEAMGIEPTPFNVLAVQKQARKVSNRAVLIARTEPMNAEHEARTLSMLASPVVGTARWELSSTHPKPDECDHLQDGDWFGLGPGIYPVDAIPARPHPRCLCIIFDELLPVNQWGEEKPRGRPQGNVDLLENLSPSKKRNLRNVLNAAARPATVAKAAVGQTQPIQITLTPPTKPKIPTQKARALPDPPPPATPVPTPAERVAAIQAEQAKLAQVLEAKLQEMAAAEEAARTALR